MHLFLAVFLKVTRLDLNSASDSGLISIEDNILKTRGRPKAWPAISKNDIWSVKRTLDHFTKIAVCKLAQGFKNLKRRHSSVLVAKARHEPCAESVSGRR
jgi:hypothetical protein